MKTIARLCDYIDAQRAIPFAWGTHDCLTFISGAVEAQIGQRPFLWVPEYTNEHEAKALANVDVLEQLDAIMTRTAINPAPRGAIIARRNGMNPILGFSLGVAVGRFVTFVGPYELEFDLQREDDLAWVV